MISWYVNSTTGSSTLPSAWVTAMALRASAWRSWYTSHLGDSGTQGNTITATTMKKACRREGSRQAQVVGILAVPYVIPEERSPPNDKRSWLVGQGKEAKARGVVFHTDIEEVHKDGQTNASPLEREDLGKIDRTADECSAVTDADDEASNDEHGDILSSRLEYDANKSNNGADPHCLLPPDPVGQFSVAKTSHSATSPGHGRLQCQGDGI